MEKLDKNLVISKNINKTVYNTNVVGFFYFLALVALITYSLSRLDYFFTPLAIAILIFFLIDALSGQIRRLPYFDSNFGHFISLPLSLFIIVFSIVEVGSFIASNMTELSSTISTLDDKILALIEKTSKITGYDVSSKLEQLYSHFSIGGIINKILSAFSSIISNITQIFLYVLFLLIDKKYFNLKINALFKNYEARARAKEVLESISKAIKTYLSITTIISLCTGILTYFVCVLFSLDGAVLWGFIAFILNFIPTLGSIIAVLIPSLFALVQFEALSNVAFLALALVIIQFSIGNVIYPKLMGNKLNISEFVVILSLVVWGMMWGAVGMFLSVPMIVILSIILSEFENTKSLAILISRNGKVSSD